MLRRQRYAISWRARSASPHAAAGLPALREERRREGLKGGATATMLALARTSFGGILRSPDRKPGACEAERKPCRSISPRPPPPRPSSPLCLFFVFFFLL